MSYSTLNADFQVDPNKNMQQLKLNQGSGQSPWYDLCKIIYYTTHSTVVY